MSLGKKKPVWRDRAVVVAVALAASLSGLWNDFAHDDVSLILQNARAHEFGNWGTIFATPYWPPPFPPELYRPVTSLLMSAEFALGVGAPVVFRVVSYLLYAVCALGVFALASRLVSRRVALAVALLFAAHPVHVEAVALGVNQAELIVGLIGVVMVARYVDLRRTRALTARDWLLFAALYAAAALTKENGFVLPAILVAAELFLFSKVEDSTRKRVALLPGFVSLAVAGVALLLVRRAVLLGDFVGTFTAEALVRSDAAGRALTMLQVVPKWFRLFAWPAHLQIDYSPNEIVASTGFGIHEALGLALLIGALALAIAARRRAPVVSFGIAWCAIALLPVANIIVPTSIVLAERTLFLPSIGFLLAVGGAAEWVLRSHKLSFVDLRRVLAAACGVFVVLGAARSAQRHTVWRNDARLWLTAGRDAPRSYRVSRAQGDAHFALGDIDGALKQYNYAIGAAPKPWRIRYDLALRLRDAGTDSAALPLLQQSLAEDEKQRDVRAELALTLIAIGRYQEAKQTIANEPTSRGDTVTVFREIESIADSALASSAPAGSIRIRGSITVDDASRAGPLAGPGQRP
jgi:hypothetical protein